MDLKRRVALAVIHGLQHGFEGEFEISETCLYDGRMAFQLPDGTWIHVNYSVTVHQPPDQVNKPAL